MSTRTRTLLVGTESGVYRLQEPPEGGRLWEAERLLECGSVRALAHEPKTGAIFVGLGLRGAGLFVSSDKGRSFALAPFWPKERQAWSLFVEEARIFVGSEPPDIWQAELPLTEWRLNESVRAIPTRKEWDFVHPPYQAHILHFARDPDDPKRFLAAVEQGGIIASEDSGSTWRQISPVWDAHVVTFFGSALVAATGEGIFVHEEGSWSRIQEPSEYAPGLAKSVSSTLFVAVRNKERPLWRSQDGRSFTPVETARTLPVPGFGVHALISDFWQKDTLYYGAEDRVWMIEQGEAHPIAKNLPAVRRLLLFS